MSSCGQYRTKCMQCKTIIHKVRSLLDEFTDIKTNEVLGICEHCQRANPSGKCRRCEYIVNKFLCNKVKQNEDKQQRFKSWLCKLNQLLHSILESENICKHKLSKDSSTLELEKLLQELKSPLEMRQPDITFFPTETGQLDSMKQSKEAIEELLIKLKSESLRKRTSDDSIFMSPSGTATSCVCKYYKDKQIEGKLSVEVLLQNTKPLLELNTRKVETSSGEESVTIKKDLDRKGSKKDLEAKDKKHHDIPSKNKTKSAKEKTSDKENVSPEKESKQKENTKQTKTPKESKQKENTKQTKTPKESKQQKPKLSPEEEMMRNMMKDRKKEKEKKEKSVKQEKVKQFAKIESLPQVIKREVIEVVAEKSESVVECGHDDEKLTEMIKGTKLVKFDPHYKEQAPDQTAPILFKIDAVYLDHETKPSTITTTTNASEAKKDKNKMYAPHKGISYELSNREFITKGWTILPTIKIMRRMNIYKMIPANPKYDWFERHKYKQIMFYDTGEKLAEIESNGRGKWFYKNGMVALDYYNAQELNAGQRYVVYSSGEGNNGGKKKPVTVLASFDFLGNGVVYDHSGNIRIKYNQTEGIVIDEKIGPQSRWKWHSLNDPPILQKVFVDSHVTSRDACLYEYLKSHEDRSESSKQERKPNAEMLAIELENFVKEKAHKLLQKFKPFEIKMKALKVNDQLSLRILDQSNIYLMFRDGPILLKLNLGMTLINTEIIDTDIAEVSEVATPYDRIPPKTTSVAEIQHTLNNARKLARARTAITPVKKTTLSKSSI